MFIRELENNKTLWWAWGALLFGYFTSFNREPFFITVQSWRDGSFVCPKYFQSCDSLYFFEYIPWGYSGTIFYMILFTLMITAIYWMYKGNWDLVWGATFPLYLWHSILTFVLSDMYKGNFEYYLFVFGTILLFFPHKEFFLKFSIVWFYMLSTIAKIHPGWIEGTYFSSLQTGLPFVPDVMIPIATNIVIMMEMIGAWFLFSSNRTLQRTVLFFFIFFHLYSGIIVEYRYPSNILPMLLIVFGPWYRIQTVPHTKKSIIPWIFMIGLLVCQLLPWVIRGDEKITLEGNSYGLYMFEANHQCLSKIIHIQDNKEVFSDYKVSSNARNRCDPYQYWYRMKTICKRNPNVAVAWQLDHSINGGPYYRIVDERNMCNLEYHPFRHNAWIKIFGDNPQLIGYPVKNLYF